MFSCFEKWKQCYILKDVFLFWKMEAMLHSQKNFLVLKNESNVTSIKNQVVSVCFDHILKRFSCFEKLKQHYFNSKQGGVCVFWSHSQKGFLVLKNESNVISIQNKVCLCVLITFSKRFSCFEKWKQRYFNSKQGGACVFWSHSQKGFPVLKNESNVISIQNKVVFVCFDHILKKVSLFWKIKATIFQFKTRWCLCVLIIFSKSFLVLKNESNVISIQNKVCLCVLITFSKRFSCFEKWKQRYFNSKQGGACVFWSHSQKGFLVLKNESNVTSIQNKVVFVCFDHILKKVSLFWKMKATISEFKTRWCLCVLIIFSKSFLVLKNESNVISIQNKVVFVCFAHILKKVFLFWKMKAMLFQFKTRWSSCVLITFSKRFFYFEKWKQCYFNSKPGGVCVFWSHSQKGFLVLKTESKVISFQNQVVFVCFDHILRKVFLLWKMKATLFQFKTRWCLCVLIKFSKRKVFLFWKMKATLFQFKCRWCLCALITFSKRFSCFEKWKQCYFNSKQGGVCVFWSHSQKGFLVLKNESNNIWIQNKVVFVCFDHILKKFPCFEKWKQQYLNSKQGGVCVFCSHSQKGFLVLKNESNVISIQNKVVFVCFDQILKKEDFLVLKNESNIITLLVGQMYVWHGCKWNFALQPAKIKSQYFGVSLKFLVCNWKYCIQRPTEC